LILARLFGTRTTARPMGGLASLLLAMLIVVILLQNLTTVLRMG
jgi:hypothetical protein